MQARFAILGAGAMGSAFGAYLARAGHPVILVDVRVDHVDAVRRDGLHLRGAGLDEVVHLDATADPAALAAVDVMLFLCKSFATRTAAAGVAHALADDGVAITVQNGLGNDTALAEVFGPSRAVPGTTTVGAMADGPGTTTVSPGTAAGSSITHLGPPLGDTSVPPRLAEVAAQLTAAGLPTEARADADVIIWTKLAVAGSMGPLTAILRRTMADVVADEHATGLWREMVEEIVAVAAAEGVALDLEATWQHCVTTARSVGPHVTSMAADVVAGRRTEVDSLVLEVARRGAIRGVPTPVVSTVGRAIAALEGSYERDLRTTVVS